MCNESSIVTAGKRQELLEQQHALARALVGVVGAPAGFDAARVKLASNALRNKRWRSAAKAWPGLKQKLRDDFVPLFAAYARVAPVPATPLDDAVGFARYLHKQGKLPRELKQPLRRFRLRSWLNSFKRATGKLKLARRRA
jgi:hypothetical protein